MRFRIVENAWWMFWADGMVVWPWVWFKKGHANIDTLYRHELEHCYQCNRMGRWKFYTSYIWLLIRHGYKQHPYEVEARKAAVQQLTPIEIEWRKQGRIG